MLREMGIALPEPPGQAAFFALYRRFGEDPISMRLAHYAARLFADQPVATVEAAGRLAADVLAGRIRSTAQAEVDHCRASGHQLLLATPAPYELVAPFGAALGFDDVVCTRYRSHDGLFDGTNESGLVWGRRKAEAVAEWAGAHAVDLAQSSAYCDSWYDVPLLELVGRPTAVNPDARLNLYARAKRWPRVSWAG